MSCGRRLDERVAEFLEAAQTACRNLERDIQHAKDEATHNATRAAHLIRAARQIVDRGR